MPGYADWKIRNCAEGAITKAQSLLSTFVAVDVYLERMWAERNESFSPEVDAVLTDVVAEIDSAEDALERAKHKLAGLFPGGPSQSVKRVVRTVAGKSNREDAGGEKSSGGE